MFSTTDQQQHTERMVHAVEYALRYEGVQHAFESSSDALDRADEELRALVAGIVNDSCFVQSVVVSWRSFFFCLSVDCLLFVVFRCHC